jgi:hypothetical protein
MGATFGYGDGARGKLAQDAFQLGKGHLNRIYVGAVGWRIAKRGGFSGQDFRQARALAGAEFVEHEEVGSRVFSKQASAFTVPFRAASNPTPFKT